MVNKNLLTGGILASIFMSALAHADLSDWYKTPSSTSNQPAQTHQEASPRVNASQQNSQQSRPSQSDSNNKPISNAQNRVNQSTAVIRNQDSNSGLEAKMNGLNVTIENLNKLSKNGTDDLTNNYLNIVQLIVISETTKSLDGKDNRALINNMLSGVIGCQNKYKVNVIQKVNSQLSRDVAGTINQYLNQNNKSIPSNTECIY